LFTPKFIFNQSYFNIVANQINFEDYSGKKTERNHGFLFLSFISLTEIAPLFRTSKKIFYRMKPKFIRCCFSLGIL
jgi:hypothetical protein